MRDILLKNLTSVDRKRKIISTYEVIDKQGVRSIIRRHFVCLVKEIKDNKIQKPSPYLYVLKERNTKEHREKFFCKMKNSLFALNQEREFLVIFMHSLRISLEAIPMNSKKYNNEEGT